MTTDIAILALAALALYLATRAIEKHEGSVIETQDSEWSVARDGNTFYFHRRVNGQWHVLPGAWAMTLPKALEYAAMLNGREEITV